MTAEKGRNRPTPCAVCQGGHRKDFHTTTVSIADGAEHPLDPRWIELQRTRAWFLTAVIAAASLIGFNVAWVASAVPALGFLFLPLWLVGVVLVAWQLRRWPAIAHRFASYRIDDLGLEIRRGVYWRTITNVPRSRVQHTDVSQGPLERRFGLGTLIVYTAGTAHSQVNLAGLDYDAARGIRTHLLPGDDGDAV
jgi:membrane protein YdbS with pleckstrin-like domain